MCNRQTDRQFIIPLKREVHVNNAFEFGTCVVGSTLLLPMKDQPIIAKQGRTAVVGRTLSAQ
jgi:hypothetical protein